MAVFSEQDFARTVTAKEIREKLFPILNQIADQEFSTILHPGLPVDDTDIADVDFSVKKMGAIIYEHLKQLSQMYIRFAIQYAKLETISRDDDGSLDDRLDSKISEILKS